MRFLLLLLLPVLLVGCGENSANTVDLKFYLKKTSGETLPLADLELIVVDKETLKKALRERSSIKKHFAQSLVNEELVTKLKGKRYTGPWHPEEIDNVEPMLDAMAEKLGGDGASEIYSSAAVCHLVNGALSGSQVFELKAEWESSSNNRISEIGHKLKASQYASEAKKAGRAVYEMFVDGRGETFSTNISGEASVKIRGNQYLFAATIVANTLVAWILPASDLNGDVVEVTQAEAFILEYIPDTIAGLHSESASLKFWFGGNVVTEDNALPALLVSDEFYIAAKAAMGELGSQDWHMQFEE